MRDLLKAMVGALLAALRPRASLVAENLALRQELGVLRRQTSRPQLRPVDRAFWVVLSRVWSRWADALALVKPASVIAWHRRGFARFWAYKSTRPGRPPIGREVIELIERMATENPMWSRRRIAAELAKLGHDVRRTPSPGTCRRDNDARGDRPRRRGARSFACTSPGPSRSTFSRCPRFTFDVLYVFFVLSLERRRILHVDVTAHPHAVWTAQQVVEAMGPDVEAVRVIRDRDSIYGSAFCARVRNMGIEQLVIASRSPWQNGYAERFVGTLRRELIDHVIVLRERHLLQDRCAAAWALAATASHRPR